MVESIICTLLGGPLPSGFIGGATQRLPDLVLGCDLVVVRGDGQVERFTTAPGATQAAASTDGV